MDAAHDDRYMLFVRLDPAHRDTPEVMERALCSCASYEEARRLRRRIRRAHADCVIRFVGETGGGD